MSRENHRYALRQSASERQCPACHRRSAMKLYSQDSVNIVDQCRYCEHVRVTKGPALWEIEEQAQAMLVGSLHPTEPNASSATLDGIAAATPERDTREPR